MGKIAALVGEGFEDAELTVPRKELESAGHELVLVGRERGERVVGKRGKASVRIEATPDRLDPGEFVALLIPGGYAPDRLRTDERAVAFVKRFCDSGKPVAAVCHGPQLLIEAGVVKGRTLTSWPSVKTDLENAGARWLDQEVVVDGNIITSRKPEDLNTFSKALISRL